jgi:hypothetical protein
VGAKAQQLFVDVPHFSARRRLLAHRPIKRFSASRLKFGTIAALFNRCFRVSRGGKVTEEA